MTTTDEPDAVLMDLSDYRARAEAWLAAHLARRAPSADLQWGQGPDDVGLFKDLTAAEERAHIDACRRWEQQKSDAGYGSISWAPDDGGAGLPRPYEDAFRVLERQFVAPAGHEAVNISMNIVAPTIRALGTPAQRTRFVRALRRTDELCCQMFSEPGAGSDLGAIAMRATFDGDAWVLNGQKVWTTGAQFADHGFVLCRTDPHAPRATAMTAFVVDLRSRGVEVRPLRQMSGGACFNEVFFDDVRVPDDRRIGDAGAGWATAMTTLGFERAAANGGGVPGPDYYGRLVLLARYLQRTADPLVRQRLARIYTRKRLRAWTARRAASGVVRGRPGPESSIAKLLWTQGLGEIAEAATHLLGPSLGADTGAWGTYAWTDVVTGAPGMRIAGGSDEIQRNTLAERVLGMPREPRPAVAPDRNGAP